jgi:hypothetical membrane protein
MDKKIYALLGLVAPLVAYVFIGLSIAFSPWFNWNRNALSDLGHSVKSGVAPVFNFSLLLTGFLITLYAVTALKGYAKWTSYSMLISAFSLQLIATFDEFYGSLHFAVSILFFVLLGLTTIVYAIERKSYLASIAFIVGFSSWIFYGIGIYSAGVALPETISTVAISTWIISSAFKIYATRK